MVASKQIEIGAGEWQAKKTITPELNMTLVTKSATHNMHTVKQMKRECVKWTG